MKPQKAGGFTERKLRSSAKGNLESWSKYHSVHKLENIVKEGKENMSGREKMAAMLELYKKKLKF